MNKIGAVVLLGAAMFFNAQSGSAQKLNELLKGLGGNNKGQEQQGASSKGGNNLGNLSNADIANGLKEALSIGVQNAGNKLSAPDGFLKNAAVKILLPKEAQQVEQTLRSVGMGAIVDKAILSMNRAAEDAAKQAAPIFIKAITTMSIQDGLNILKGGNNAATQYLQAKASPELSAAFRPVIQKSLDKVGAPGMWKTVFSTYNNLPLVKDKVNPDLTSYVTERAMNGIFVGIADEEAKIRTDPGAQVTSLLKKVFGG